MRRADDPATLMEIYEDVADPAAFEDALGNLVRDTGLQDLLPPSEIRHVERFIPCA